MLYEIPFDGASAMRYSGTMPSASWSKRRSMMHFEHPATAFRQRRYLCRPWLPRNLCTPPCPFRPKAIQRKLLSQHNSNRLPWNPPAHLLPNPIPISHQGSVLIYFNNGVLPALEARYLDVRLMS